MIISIMLIIAVGYWNVNPLALLMLMVTWLPDVLFLMFMSDVIRPNRDKDNNEDNTYY